MDREDRTPDPPPGDEDAARLLDDYLARLHAGESVDRATVLAERPDLAWVLSCLEVLDGMAPRPSVSPATINSLEEVSEERDAAFDGVLPRHFGQYELLAEIGRGGMGVVYKARQTELDRIVAVKMILSGYLASPDHVRRFRVEAQAAARLQHSNIVHIHEVGQVHGQHFFTMEYIEGESLAQRIARAPLDFDSAVRLMITVARAVDYLHRQKIVHRDLKPSNILIDAEGQPYVTDFGLVKFFEQSGELTSSGLIAGTPSYMAPEQALGRTGGIGPAADVYSLGAVLYELLTGRPPFSEENPIDTLMSVLGSEPAPPRSLNPKAPAGLERICLKCLAKTPAERYASAGALADDLERFAKGEPLAVQPPTVVQRAWSWARRKPGLTMRLSAMAFFYTLEWVNFLAGTGGIDLPYHQKMSALIGLWLVVSLVFQRLTESPRYAAIAGVAWAIVDSALILAALLISNGAASPLIAAYPLLVVGSGLWFRVRYVWLITGLSLLSYSVLVVDLYLWRPHLREIVKWPFDSHIIFAMTLIVLSATVAHLVGRVRSLSNFYGRPLP